MKNFALIGNPNSGKTTLFNTLTGLYQKTGNFTGVTTEKKEGRLKKDKGIKVVDLPGTYSLTPKSQDERTAVENVKSKDFDVVIDVVDGTNLERNLYLTAELIKEKIPIVIAINFSDDLKKDGIFLDEKKLSNVLKVPVVKISALKNTGIEELISIAKNYYETKRDFCEIPEDLYSFIEKTVVQVIENKKSKREVFTEKADRILMNRYFGIPIFFLVMTFVYYCSLKGGILGEYLSDLVSVLSKRTADFLTLKRVPEFLISLISSAVIKGVGEVLSFLPQILILFFFMSIMEESGYSARVAFLFDGIFKKIGLSGKSVISLTLSCGCAVSGITSCKTVEDDFERENAIFLCPFMPCGAKTAIFGWFSYAFFNGNPWIASSMYFLGIFSVFLFGFILKKIKGGEKERAFFLEIPPIRTPSVKDVALTLLEKVKDFTLKAGTVIFLVSVGLWVLQNFGINGYTHVQEESFLFLLGNALKYIFYPLGFFKWEYSVALISGIFAKEGVVESIKLISTDFSCFFESPFIAYSYMAFILLSPPCMATLVCAKKELKSTKKFCLFFLFQFLTAYIVSFFISFSGFLYQRNLLLPVIIVIIIALGVFISVKILKRVKCRTCNFKECYKCKKKRNTTI